MGGNCLKNTVTRRYDKFEYFTLRSEVLEKLSKWDIGLVEVIPAYHEKETFGDMDILYASGRGKIPVDFLRDEFSPNEIVVNGGVTSFDYKEFQIDLIHTTHKKFDYALSYFSWNDCGNLVGKLAHRFGLKHGHDGLFLSLHDGHNKFGSILLTENHDDTLKFLGLDVKKFKNGFDNLEEIFAFVAASPNYSPDWYLLENITSAGRIRDKKRDTYRRFLEFGAAYTGPRATKIVNKNDCLDLIFKSFPAALPKFESIMAGVALKTLVRSKFNGDLVTEITGLKEKELGKFMEYLRGDFDFHNTMIAYLPDVQIRQKISKKFAVYKKRKGKNHLTSKT